jgi:CRISPR-associated endonuclease Csn1
MKPEKLILGLDIGVSSVGLALVKSKNNGEQEIVKLAVRIVPEDPNFHGKFYAGLTASKNAERTLERSKRKNNQRFKLRRDALVKCLSLHNMMPGDDLVHVDSMSLYGLRAKAVEQQLTLKELGRVLMHLNQRRGFYSNRKATTADENSTEYKQKIQALQEQLDGGTIGQALYKELLQSNNTNEVLLRERTYLRSSYIEEFDRIWDCQRQYHSEVLTGAYGNERIRGTLYHRLRNMIMFYQRPLKSQKGLVNNCLFEKGHKAINKSNPLFEMFRIWQQVNDIAWKNNLGEVSYPTLEQKQKLAAQLFAGEGTNATGKMTISKIKEFFGYGTREKIYFNFEELYGARTYSMIAEALHAAGVEDIEKLLQYDHNAADEKGGLFELWHIAYSLPTREDVCNTLVSRFHNEGKQPLFTKAQAELFADTVQFNADYGSLSSRAIKKLLPHMQLGLGYSAACDAIDYDHSGYKTKVAQQATLQLLKRNSLRNPVVEQILNQVVNSVNTLIAQYGKPDEIRVELARELRNNAEARERITKNNSKNKKSNDGIRERLKTEYNFSIVNGRDVKRYTLWQETEQQCLYCGQQIAATEFVQGLAEIEHILPKSRSFSNAMSNYILAHKKCNSTKNQETAYDFMAAKDPQVLADYIERVNALYKDGKGLIGKAKFGNLLCKGEDIPSDFVDRMKNDTQYISKEAVKLLKQVCESTYTTTGQITDFLREQWGLKQVLQELNLPKYKQLGQVEYKTYKDREGQVQQYESIVNWTKRDDHRHHAVDALICALTNQAIVFKLNNLNKIYQYEKGVLNKDETQTLENFLQAEYNIKNFAELKNYYVDEPISNLRQKAKMAIDDILISFKKPTSKVLSKNTNKPKHGSEQITFTPRGRLHEATEMSGRLHRATKPTKLTAKFDKVDLIVDQKIRALVIDHLAAFGNDAAKAFDSKLLKKQPLLYKEQPLAEVLLYEPTSYKRVALNPNISTAMLQKIVDKAVKDAVHEHLDAHNGNIKLAFGNIAENPVYLNRAKGIKIKSVTIRDKSTVVQVRNSFVKTGGNHHAIIYKDSQGKYNEKMVSFWEATEIARQRAFENGNKVSSVIDTASHPMLGTFMYSVQINDLFVLGLKHSEQPQTEDELNFYDMHNRARLSAHLFRVQKISSGNYAFRHHLETTVTRDIAANKGLVWDEFQSISKFALATKVRIDHVGNIIGVEKPL